MTRYFDDEVGAEVHGFYAVVVGVGDEEDIAVFQLDQGYAAGFVKVPVGG